MNPTGIQILPETEASRITADWGELTWFASNALNNTTLMTVGRCVLLPGCANPRHYHPNCTEILVVIEGEIEHTADASGATTRMCKGDTVTIPPNIFHQARNVGECTAVLFIVFDSPDRQTIGE